MIEYKQLSILELNLDLNGIGEQGAESLSSALSQLKNLTSLKLNLGWSEIGDKESLSSRLNLL